MCVYKEEEREVMAYQLDDKNSGGELFVNVKIYVFRANDHKHRQ